MTTLLVSEVFPPKTGGSGRWFWELYRRLPRDEYAVAAGEDPRQELFDRTHDLQISRLPLHLECWGIRSLSGLRGYWVAVHRLRRLIDEKQVKRLHCARCVPEGLMAWFLKNWLGIGYICYAHGEELTCASVSREMRWLARRALRGADFVIANSHNTARILRSDWSLDHGSVRVLHPGVDTGLFVPTPRHAALRAHLGWHDRPVVLTVGRLQRRKGHDQMIKALGAVRRAVPNVLYAIVGDGEERSYLEKLVATEGHGDHVQFLTEVNDARLLECYQQCDLFVLPNRQVDKDIEGFGMVLVEAQACGRAVIAGQSGGTAETMRIPDTGWVVNCEGHEALSAAVVDLLCDSDRLESMGKAARAWVVERFDWTPLCARARRIFQTGKATQKRVPAGSSARRGPAARSFA